MPENAMCSPGRDKTNFDTDTSTTSTASTTKSAIRRRRKLRLLFRSQDWMAVLQRATAKPAGCIFIFIFNFEVADFAMANELELMATYIIWEMVVIPVSWKEFQKIDGGYRQDTHSQHTSTRYGLSTSAERIASAWLKNCITSLCAWKASVIRPAHVSPVVALSPAVHHEHFIFHIHSFFPPRHQNTHHNRDNTIYSKNTHYIINLSKTSQSTSSAIKNHSGGKTCRVAETRAKHSPQVMLSSSESVVLCLVSASAKRHLTSGRCASPLFTSTRFDGYLTFPCRFQTVADRVILVSVQLVDQEPVSVFLAFATRAGSSRTPMIAS